MLLLLMACHQGIPGTDTDPTKGTVDTDPTVQNDDTGPTDDTGPGDSTPPDTDTTPPEPDADGDGFLAPEDCDDTNPDVNPDAPEVPGNGLDDDCDGLRGESTWILSGSADDAFGVVMGPGDVDGDKRGDLLVGAAYTDHHRGVVYLFSGAAITGDGDVGDAVATFEGDDSTGDGWAGDAASGPIGDLDGDGFAELGYGAHYQDVDGVANTGAFYFWAGGTHLRGSLQSTDADAIYASADGAGELGWAGTGVGDLDGDGYTDLALSAPRAGGRWDGRVFLVAGSATLPAGRVDVDTAAASFVEGTDYSLLGWSICPDTDVDGDGNTDLVTGSYYGPSGYPGAVSIWYGPGFPSGGGTPPTVIPGVSGYGGYGTSITCADLDGDHVQDLAASAPTAAAAYVTWDLAGRPRTGNLSTGDQYGATGMGGVGAADLDLDGVADLVLGVPGQGDVLVERGGVRRGFGVDPLAEAWWAVDGDPANAPGRWITTLDAVPGTRPAVAVSAEGAVILLVQVD